MLSSVDKRKNTEIKQMQRQNQADHSSLRSYESLFLLSNNVPYKHF